MISNFIFIYKKKQKRIPKNLKICLEDIATKRKSLQILFNMICNLILTDIISLSKHLEKQSK